jgi:FlaA1/EpsC-like NDP-sugar epimerase
VGLVLLAGLGGYGELCILDMGEPIKIADLAANMITMAGLVPHRDIKIEFTGLRPGEKLEEELFTEEEEQTQQVRNKIQVAKAPPPPADLAVRLEALRRAAELGDPQTVKAELRDIIPSYQTPGHSLPSNVTPLRPVGGQRA